jgi:hypothetical protein
MNNRSLRWFLLLLLGGVTFGLGLMRYDYVLNFIDVSKPFLLPRTIAEQTTYPMDFGSLMNSLLHDPRWLSTLFYMIYPAIGTCIAIYLIFQKKKYVQLTLLFYSAGMILLLIFISYSILFHEYANGYAMAQYLKKIFQEPYASLLLLGSFYWDQKNKK